MNRSEDFHHPPASPQAAAGVPVLGGEAEAYEVDVTVRVSLFPEVRQVRMCTDDGFEYAITPATPGVEVESLRQGQRLRCLVTPRLARVLRVQVFE